MSQTTEACERHIWKYSWIWGQKGICGLGGEWGSGWAQGARPLGFAVLPSPSVRGQSPSGCGGEQTCAPLAGGSVSVTLQKHTRDAGSIAALWKGRPGAESSLQSGTCLVKKASGGCFLFPAPASSAASGGARCLLSGYSMHLNYLWKLMISLVENNQEKA